MVEPQFIGMMRIKNEARWIAKVIEAQLPLVQGLLILDDHSTDNTVEICRRYDKVRVIESPFDAIDESRDKQFLLEKVFDAIPDEHQHYANGNPESPWFAVCFDGDELLMQEDIPLIRTTMSRPGVHALSFRIVYLWDSESQWRTDGVYGRFRRPSLFRLMNRNFQYQKTPFGNGANFHCSSIPQELIHHSSAPEAQSNARLLHYGYMCKEDRLRKWAWYNSLDGNNVAEDCYRHCVQGDIPEVPAGAILKHAGPLRLEKIQ